MEPKSAVSFELTHPSVPPEAVVVAPLSISDTTESVSNPQTSTIPEVTPVQPSPAQPEVIQAPAQPIEPQAPKYDFESVVNGDSAPGSVADLSRLTTAVNHQSALNCESSVPSQGGT